MKYFIAIDGGGSKTDVVLFDETGHIVYRHVGKGGNPTDVGVEEAQRRMFHCLDQVFPHAPGEIIAVYGGIAGVVPNGDVFSEGILQRYEFGRIHVEDDGFSLISSTLGHGDGCGMVCGTGSSLFVRKAGEPLRHIGGKGYLIDTGGSGFELGKEAICMAFRAMDGRCKSTMLTELVSEIFGQPMSYALIPAAHWGGRSYIASFAPAVFKGREAGDWACTEIFERGAALMADLTYAAERYFESAFPIVMGGGIAANFPEYVEAIKAKASPMAKIVPQQAPPVYGAATEAMRLAEADISELFREKFLADYTQTAPSKKDTNGEIHS